MKWMRKAAAAVAAVCVGLGVPAAVEAQTQTLDRTCKKNCDTIYQSCLRRSTDPNVCMDRWRICKKKCVRPATAQTPTPK